MKDDVSYEDVEKVIKMNSDKLVNYFLNSNHSDGLMDKVWSTIEEKQKSINKQLEELEKKNNQRIEETNRLIDESEQKLFKQMEVQNLRIKDISKQYEIESPVVEDEQDDKKSKKKTKKSKQIKAQLKSDNVNDARYLAYSTIHNAITDSGLDGPEKLALMEAVSAVFQKY